MKVLYISIICLIAFSIANSQDTTFTELTTVNLTGVVHGSAVWGDYDNDGDLDILLSGDYDYSNGIAKIYRNNGNSSFTEQTSIQLTGVYWSAAAWGDYDNDGDLDILLTGRNGNIRYSKIYRNNGNNNFAEQSSISLTAVSKSSVAWGDYNNDGDLDILLTGENSVGEAISKIYSNEGNNNFLEQSSIQLTEVINSSVAWGDYDNDGDLDILLTGDSNDVTSKIYRNEGDNSFTEQTSISLIGVGASSAAWGDYDNDGDLDILLTGRTVNYQQISKIYRNNGNNTFTEQTSISLMGVENSQTKSSAWGDYDNDGDLDILLTGYNGIGRYSMIYRNNGDNTFTEMTSINILDVFDSCVDWGDYDNDGDLDILITGSSEGDIRNTKIYRNNSQTANTIPTSPTNLISITDSTSVTLGWSKSTDNETPQAGLNYNIVISSIPGGVDVVSPMSDRATGYRNVLDIGNTNHNNSWKINELIPGVYYWSVQAIDNSFAGSYFSPEQVFYVLQQNITVVVPNGGEVWQVGSVKNINWNSTEVLNVKIELSTNNGASWTAIVDSTPSNGIYTWVVPNTPSIQSLIKISDIDNSSVYDVSDSLFTIEQVVSTDIERIPEDYSLGQNFPNPFNPSTTIKYQIPRRSHVTIKIFDLLGKEIATLVDEEKSIGIYEVFFDATKINSGIYFYRFQTESFVETKKMILLK